MSSIIWTKAHGGEGDPKYMDANKFNYVRIMCIVMIDYTY